LESPPSDVIIESEFKSHLIVIFIKESMVVSAPREYNMRLTETLLLFRIFKISLK
jgi:hypothetical protein